MDELGIRQKNCCCLLAYNHFFIGIRPRWTWKINSHLRNMMRIKEGGPLSGTFQIKNDLKPKVYKGQWVEINRRSGDRSRRQATKFDFRAKTAGRWAESCPHPPSTNPVHISTHPPHPRWASRLMRLVSNRLTSRRIRRSREPLTLKMRGNGWSEKTTDQRKLLWQTQNPNHNRVSKPFPKL